jgi:hypothetical protein
MPTENKSLYKCMQVIFIIMLMILNRFLSEQTTKQRWISNSCSSRENKLSVLVVALKQRLRINARIILWCRMGLSRKFRNSKFMPGTVLPNYNPRYAESIGKRIIVKATTRPYLKNNLKQAGRVAQVLEHWPSGQSRVLKII